ncbi:unnamed protein product [Dimorphilus gyrociliatus]|uniref:2-phosphoxylose phosphatase 1 n=1 Tax=Dimorphilus gyrociliatus TaxID=2664684 RepID=A0A7I8VHF1_9ANNE|nr:unnamed protein product [Dimorphilus gyrociliatus]
MVKKLTSMYRKLDAGSLLRKFGIMPNKELCAITQLTPAGFLQTIRIGKLLRSKYSSFLSNIRKQDIYVRTTERSRTVQSAVGFLYGLLDEVELPPFKVSASTNFCSTKWTLIDKCFCKKRKVLQKASKLNETLRNIPEIVDNLMAHKCNDVNFDHPVSERLADEYWTLLDDTGAAQLKNEEFFKLHKLLAHPFLCELSLRMFNATKDSKLTPKIALYSGHDLTIKSVLTALGLFDGRWPSFAARVVFELYETPEGRHQVRILYNGIDISDKAFFCRPNCSLNNFVKFCKIDNLKQFRSAKSYRDACDS